MNDFVLQIKVTKPHVQVTILAGTGDYTTGFRDDTTGAGDDSTRLCDNTTGAVDNTTDLGRHGQGSETDP